MTTSPTTDGRLSLTRRRLVVAGVTLGVAGLALANYLESGPSEDGLVFVSVGLLLLTVGSILVLRVPENRVSWVMMSVAVGVALSDGLPFVSAATSDFIGGIGLWGMFLPGIGVLVPLWFPTGYPMSPRWRWVSWMAGAGFVGIMGGAALYTMVEGGGNEIESCSSLGTCASLLGVVLLLLAVVAALVALVVRSVRATGIERLQMKWLVLAVLVFVIGAGAEFGGFQGSLIANVFLPAGLILIPLAIAFAITRYRLYDIDRIVSRTVSYTLVVVFLGAVYVGGVTWLTSLLPDRSQLAVAATTLAVAALFNPVRRRVQGLVDRRFNRSRYDTQRVMDGFVGSLRDQVDVEAVVDGWLGVVARTMQPAAAAVWVKRP